MSNQIHLDPVKIPDQHLIALFLFIDRDLDDPMHYVNLILDTPLSRLGGKPARYATDNDLCLRIIKDKLVPKWQIPVANAFNDSSPSGFDKNTKLAYDFLIDQMFGMIDLGIPDKTKVERHLETQTYTVASANLCSFMFFYPGQIKTSPIISCPKCKSQYDLSRSAFIVGDEEVEGLFRKIGWEVIKHQRSGRKADLLVKKEKSIDREDLNRTRHRVLDLRNDPSFRWMCDNCHDGENGYPGSFIMHDFFY